MTGDKISFKGAIISVQPRIRLIRSFDERSHNYLGYALVVRGFVDSVEREFSIGIGKAAQTKYEFRVGDEITGECVPVPDERLEPVQFYKVSRFKKTGQTDSPITPPPWENVPPALETYRERGHRRLAVSSSVLWGRSPQHTGTEDK